MTVILSKRIDQSGIAIRTDIAARLVFIFAFGAKRHDELYLLLRIMERIYATHSLCQYILPEQAGYSSVLSAGVRRV